jgi:hypothetical protein
MFVLLQKGRSQKFWRGTFPLRRLKAIIFGLLLLCGFCAIGCGGSDNTGNFGGGFQQVITGLAVSPKPVTKTSGQTQQFTATATANDGSTGDVTSIVTWTSSNPAVVSITNTGLATANAAGTATITASGAGFSDNVVFTVTGTGTPINLVALDAGGTNLVRFSSTNPGTPTSVPITGVLAGDQLVGLDVRPQNHFLYALGFNSAAGSVNLYHVNPDNGFATAVNTAPTTFVDAANAARPITGTAFGFDFNPTVDRIRVVTNTGQDFRLNPNDGAGVDGNAAVGVQMDGDINGGGATAVAAAAYTNNQQNATITTLYTLDATTNNLFIQNPPNDGTQSAPQAITLNGNPLDFSAVNGFDIAMGVNAPASNSAVLAGSGIASLVVNGTTNLYSINLVNGQATLLGIPNNGLSALAIIPDGAPPAIGLSNANLLRFNSATPGTAVTVPIGGIQAGEVLVGIDYRPATGQLFALGINAAADTGSVYRIDPQSGANAAAFVIGAANSIAFTTDGVTPVDFPDPATTGYGFDFNPTVDRIRVTTGTGLNFRVNQVTGTPVDGNNGGAVAVTGTNPDGSINGGSTGVVGAAYTNNFSAPLNTTATTLYTLDAAADRLFIQNPPNAGTQTSPVGITLGGSPLDFTAFANFDIGRGVNVATSNTAATGNGSAVLTVAGVTSLYTLNLTTGAATLVGPVAAGLVPLQGFTLGN